MIIGGALMGFVTPVQAIDFSSVDKDTSFHEKHAARMDDHQIYVGGKFEEHQIKVRGRMDQKDHMLKVGTRFKENQIKVNKKFEEHKIKVRKIDGDQLKMEH